MKISPQFKKLLSFYSFLSVFCEVDDDDDLRRRRRFAEPFLTENSFQYHTLLVDLLEQDEQLMDHDYNRGFQILPFFHHMHQDHCTRLMEVAIMSPYFDYTYKYNYQHLIPKLLASVIYYYVRVSIIERGDEFRFPPSMINTLSIIVLFLHKSSMPSARREATALLQNITLGEGGSYADLPEELLRIIASNLFGKDLQSFSQVCKSWNAADSICRRSPCLMSYNRGKKEWQFHQHSRVFHVKLPELDGAHICSSNHGWLLMSRKDGTLFFFDPFNRRTIDLPSASRWERSFMGIHFFHPPTSPECFIVGFHCFGIMEIEIFKRSRGKDCWETHEKDCGSSVGTLSPPILRRGVLYFVDMSGNVTTFDLVRSCWTFFTNCFPFPRLRSRKIKQHYPFQIKGDDALYAAFLIHDAEKVNVFRLSEPKMEWKLVRDLGDKMVYLSHTSCFGATAPIGSMANKLYFPIFHDNAILSYSLNTRKYHSLDGDYSHDDNTHGLTTFTNTGVAWIMHAPHDDANWPADTNHSSWPQIQSEIRFNARIPTLIIAFIMLTSFIVS